MKDIILIVCVYLVAVYIYILYIYIYRCKQQNTVKSTSTFLLSEEPVEWIVCVCVADPNGPAAFPKEHWLVLPIQNTPKLPMD